LVYKLEPTKKIHIFYLQMVLVVLRILNICVLEFWVMSVVWSIWVCGSFYGLVQALFLSLGS